MSAQRKRRKIQLAVGQPKLESENGKPIGRPPKLTREMATVLENAVKMQGSLRSAAALCGIGLTTLHSWLNRYPQLRADLSRWREEGLRAVRVVLFQRAVRDKDLRAAMYLLDRRDPDFQPKATIVERDGGADYGDEALDATFL